MRALLTSRKCLQSRRLWYAKVAELVDALDLGSCGVTRESSSLSFRTIYIRRFISSDYLSHSNPSQSYPEASIG